MEKKMSITVKQFCEIYKCDYSSIYRKIRRKIKNGELSELNVYKENGTTMLDDVAEITLKPTSVSELKDKIETLEKAKKVYQQSDYETKSLLDDKEKENELLKKSYSDLKKKYASLREDYNKLSEEKTQILADKEKEKAEYQKKIDELTEEIASLKKPRKLFG